MLVEKLDPEHQCPRLIPSSTSTCTPSTRCSTVPHASSRSSRPPSSRACRRSRSPTTATCSAPSTSGARRPTPGIKPIIGTEAYLTPGTHRTDKTRVRWGDGGGDDVSGSRRLHAHDAAGRDTTEGMHNLFRLSSLRVDRGLLLQAADGPRAAAAATRRASSRRPAARRGEVQTRLRLGQYDEAVKAAAEFRDIFGKENFFAEIMDHGHRHRAPDHERPAAARERARASRWWPPTTCTTRTRHDADEPRGAAVRAVRRRRSTTRTGSSSTPTSST